MKTYFFTFIWYEYNILKAVTVNLSHPSTALYYLSQFYSFWLNVLFIYLMVWNYFMKQIG